MNHIPPGGPHKPWTPEYLRDRQAYLERIVADEDVLGLFADERPLPDGFGLGLDERCVEYPWVLARLRGAGPRLLDAGSALNHPWLLARPELADRDLHVMTMAPEPYCAWEKGVSYVFGDLRDIPMRDGWYDAVACVSTLEHVGFDNTHYGGQARQDGADESRPSFLEALRELRRVLRPGGSLLVTAPFGLGEDLGIARQFDARLVDRLTEAFAPERAEAEYFMITAGGWRRAARTECAGARYVRWAIDFFVDPAGFDLSAAPTEPDHAAAARAVACLRLVK